MKNLTSEVRISELFLPLGVGSADTQDRIDSTRP